MAGADGQFYRRNRTDIFQVIPKRQKKRLPAQKAVIKWAERVKLMQRLKCCFFLRTA